MKLDRRGCTIEDIKDALESNKKFEFKNPNDSTIILELIEELDAPTVVTLRNKVLKTNIKGVSDI